MSRGKGKMKGNSAKSRSSDKLKCFNSQKSDHLKRSNIGIILQTILVRCYD